MFKTKLLSLVLLCGLTACGGSALDTNDNPDMTSATAGVDLAGVSSDPDIASLKHGRTSMSSVVGKDGTIYAIGGFDQLYNHPTVEAYDPATNTWTERATMPQRLFCASAHVLDDGTILVFGGATDDQRMVDSIYAYTPATDTWTSRGTMPKRRASMMSAMSKSGRIYFVGGSTPDDPELEDTSVYGCSSLVESYDPATGTWTEQTRMKSSICDGTMATATNGTIYLTGGYNQQRWLPFLQSYDETADTWKKLQSPKHVRLGSVIVAMDELLYVIGGDEWNVDDNIATVDVEIFSTTTLKWTNGPALPMGRTFASGAPLPGGRILIAGGRGGRQGTEVSLYKMFRTAVALTPSTGTWTHDTGPTSLD